MPLVEAAHQAGVRVAFVCTLFNASQLRSLLQSAPAWHRLIVHHRYVHFAKPERRS